jgi:hypothetical protein
VQPSVKHLSSLQHEFAQQADMIVRVSYSDARAADWLASRTGLPVIELPATVDFQHGESLFDWFDTVIERLSAA